MRTACILSLVLLSSVAGFTEAARDRDPCDKNGQLKGWARKDGYSQDVCSSADTAPANTAPSVTITAPTNGDSVAEGTQVTLSGVASDSEDGDLSSKISWSSSLDGAISTTTGLSVGTHTITASVSDSGGLSASDQVSITVEAAVVNTAPSITITAPATDSTVVEGSLLTLTGSASDKEDGDLSAGISWRSSLDGALSTTTSLSVGTHTITASVSDSGGLTATAQVLVTVTASTSTLSSVKLSWTIPDSRENGEPLQLYEIGGYEILFKKAGDLLYYSETITDASTSEYIVGELEPGDYEFKIAAFDIDGLLSSYTVKTALVE